MKKFLIIIIIVAAIYLLHRFNPSFDDHKLAIAPNSSQLSVVWEDLVYKDYFVISFTQSAGKKSMVSYGLCTYVHVADEKWSPAGQ